ncbi:MAG: FMN-binding negative transcriptional regulator [Parcubacteria group bacterium]
MHPAAAFRERNEAALRSLVAGRGFGLVLGAVDGRPVVAHAALLLEERTLRFHLSRANALTPVLEAGGTALVVVSGPDAYVSPDWYGLDDQVPTWNYLSVEMEGPVAPLDDPAAAVLLDDLSAYFEARLAPKAPWAREKMTPGRFDALLQGIRAFKMRVERFEGTTKLSQNKPASAVEGVIEALEAAGSSEMARLMRLRLGA